MDRGCVAGASDLDEMIFAFDLQGYVILKSVISAERLAKMNALIDSQVQQPASPVAQPASALTAPCAAGGLERRLLPATARGGRAGRQIWLR